MPIDVHLDLRSLLGPARDQGSRPTCLAFAASDTHTALRGDLTQLSAEWAFFHAQRRGGRTAQQGATLAAMLETLREDGQPIEQGWPYLTVLPAKWSPPASVGPLRRRASGPASIDLPSIITSLNLAWPVILLMSLSHSFYLPDGGVVRTVPSEAPDHAVRHAVVAIGHGLVDGQAAILVRNSWGSGWGLSGHAWLTEDYLMPRLFAAAVLLEKLDVPSGPHPA